MIMLDKFEDRPHELATLKSWFNFDLNMDKILIYLYFKNKYYTFFSKLIWINFLAKSRQEIQFNSGNVWN